MNNAVLPRAYQQVEWISNGTSSVSAPAFYIDTGCTWTTSGLIGKMQIMSYAVGSSYNWLAYGHPISGYNNVGVAIVSSNFVLGTSTHETIGISASANTLYTLEWQNKSGDSYLTVNGTKKTSSTTFSPRDNIYLFSQQYAVSHTETNKSFKIFYCKLYNISGVLKRNYYPCYRKSDGVVGLYNKAYISGDSTTGVEFYSNAGTGGNFTMGSECNKKL